MPTSPFCPQRKVTSRLLEGQDSWGLVLNSSKCHFWMSYLTSGLSYRGWAMCSSQEKSTAGREMAAERTLSFTEQGQGGNRKWLCPWAQSPSPVSHVWFEQWFIHRGTHIFPRPEAPQSGWFLSSCLCWPLFPAFPCNTACSSFPRPVEWEAGSFCNGA